MLLASVAMAQQFVEIKPSPQQMAWQELEIGVIVHFGTNTFLDREWGDGTADPKVFNPTQLDPEQWVLASKAAGAKYLVMVAKHHDGFCLWPSKQTKYSVASSPWKGGKGNLVHDVAEACRKHGLKMGVYLSPWDRHEPVYADSKAYDAYYAKQVVELANLVPDIVEFWLDGAGSEGHVYDFERYIRQLRTYQPNALIFSDVALLPYGDIRWVGNEAGIAKDANWNVIDAYQVLRWRPAECDTPLRERHWFWHPNDEKSVKSLDALMDTYHKSVGRGAQLMLGIAPDNRGLLPDSDVKRLMEFGDEVRRVYAKNLVLDRQNLNEPYDAAMDGDADTFASAPDGTHSANLYVGFAEPVSFDRALTMEWLGAGQMVQKYDIQVQAGGEWKTVCAGTSIGHKKIDIFPRVTASAVRLRILSAAQAPHVAEFQLYDAQRAK